MFMERLGKVKYGEVWFGQVWYGEVFKMNIDINDDYCWVCGKKFIINDKFLHMTKHHTLPKHLNPKKNVTAPVCKRCHGKLNAHDVRGLFAFAYKLDRTVEDVKQMTGAMWQSVSKHFNRGGKK